MILIRHAFSVGKRWHNESKGRIHIMINGEEHLLTQSDPRA